MTHLKKQKIIAILIWIAIPTLATANEQDFGNSWVIGGLQSQVISPPKIEAPPAPPKTPKKTAEKPQKIKLRKSILATVIGDSVFSTDYSPISKTSQPPQPKTPTISVKKQKKNTKKTVRKIAKKTNQKTVEIYTKSKFHPQETHLASWHGIEQDIAEYNSSINLAKLSNFTAKIFEIFIATAIAMIGFFIFWDEIRKKCEFFKQKYCSEISSKKSREEIFRKTKIRATMPLETPL